MQLQELINCFIIDVCEGKTNMTEAAYRSKLRRLTLFFEPEKEISEITLHNLDEFKYTLQTRKTHLHGSKQEKGGLSPFTIRTCLVTTRFLFSWATTKGYLPSNPMNGVRMPKLPPIKPKAINSETVVKLLRVAAITGENWRRARNIALIYILQDTGGRASGIANAKIGDLDLANGIMMVTEKGGKEQPLLMTSITIDAVRTWLEWRSTLHIKSDKVFLTWCGKALSYRGLYSTIRELAKAANVKIGEYWNPHSFRHAFARECILNGADISQVSAMMGHPDSRVTTMYYARWNTREQKDVHSKTSPVLKMPEVKPDFLPEVK